MAAAHPTARASANLDAQDMQRLARFVDQVLIRSGQPGAMLALGYNLSLAARQLFFDAIVESLGQHPCDFLAVAARQKGEMHLAAAVATKAGIVDELLAEARESIEIVDPFC